MRIFTLILVLTVFAGSVRAQVTNDWPTPPLTKLEAMDTNVSVVILKGSTDAGSISAHGAAVGVRCRESTDTSTGHKEQGLVIEIAQPSLGRDVLLIDYDEIASLIGAINYISKLEVTATPLSSFDAAYTTRGGFRIAALGTRTTGAIQFGVRDARINSMPVTFSRDQMSRLSDIINQAKNILDSIGR